MKIFGLLDLFPWHNSNNFTEGPAKNVLLQEEFGKRRSLEKQNLKTTAAGIRGETPGANIHPQKYGGL